MRPEKNSAAGVRPVPRHDGVQQQAKPTSEAAGPQMGHCGPVTVEKAPLQTLQSAAPEVALQAGQPQPTALANAVDAHQRAVEGSTSFPQNIPWGV